MPFKNCTAQRTPRLRRVHSENTESVARNLCYLSVPSVPNSVYSVSRFSYHSPSIPSPAATRSLAPPPGAAITP
jgi:hypothetical protein